MEVLKAFDKRQFFRFFIDGCQLHIPRSWRGAEEREPGFVQAMLAAWELILDNFDLSGGIKAGYLKRLHKACASVRMTNLKNTPGDVRYLGSMILLHTRTVTLAGLEELLLWRRGDDLPIFYEPGYDKPADELDPGEVLQAIREMGYLTFRPWYPLLTEDQAMSLDRRGTMIFSGSFADFYRTKQGIQKSFAQRLDTLLQEFNSAIRQAGEPDEKIVLIAQFTRKLEILHAFPDGNGRTFVAALMNHLLLYHGFCPAVLYDKDVNIAISSAEWVEVIQEGMNNTRRLLVEPEMRLHGYSILDSDPADLEEFLGWLAPITKKLAEWPGDA